VRRVQRKGIVAKGRDGDRRSAFQKTNFLWERVSCYLQNMWYLQCAGRYSAVSGDGH